MRVQADSIPLTLLLNPAESLLAPSELVAGAPSVCDPVTQIGSIPLQLAAASSSVDTAWKTRADFGGVDIGLTDHRDDWKGDDGGTY